ncbi:DUF805 domain-containing protein [Roseibium salinum]|uniref:DUF805 domain-containing protein n=1 Tax=Roseibium salinum TaxID=1604349 RepID=A0ABT3QYN7_9HYPH|nr:DUF805 domain-containing protein [Roseibium sp. DSM 29163]MCX2721946.1 DUF805 domain-containing protein [Roseibium sp. DSM 29163]
MAAIINPFHGRIGRLQWWLLQFVIFAFAVAGLLVTIFLFAESGAPAGPQTVNEQASLLLIAFLVVNMNFSTCINRLRDTGRSGFWYLTFLLPAVGTGLMIYFCGVEPGKKLSTPAEPDSRLHIIT